jgi:phospholipase D1/2
MTFFSLRGWGKHKSGVLTTEQVYIHGKTCIIDDRKSALTTSCSVQLHRIRG